jgi:hypothetical protein
MLQSLGTIEVIGSTAAIEAADTACKSADVKLLGYEATDGMGMVAVKLVGQIGAVKAAIAAAQVAAGAVNKVVAVSVIPRPNSQIEPIVKTPITVGLGGPTSVKPNSPGAQVITLSRTAPAPAPTAPTPEPTAPATPAQPTTSAATPPKKAASSRRPKAASLEPVDPPEPTEPPTSPETADPTSPETADPPADA